jgi:tRNA modification GTPase
MQISEGTIAALSTPEGVGGIAVVRLSGPDALTIVTPCLSTIPEKPLRVYFSRFADPEKKEFIDDVLVTFFKAPHSYTGEDVVEISCHGGRIIYGLILNTLYQQGARPAMPGEFTRRAFINGKMDLTQAEAVADMIHAETEISLKSARELLHGRLSGELDTIRTLLMDAVALLEVGLDFSDQDIETIDPMEVHRRIRRGQENVKALIASYKTGRILHDGARIPIVGKPNAGKSSLMNAILREERVITSDIPGTTRDYIEEHINHSGYLIRLYDTAGLRDTADVLEQAGLKKTQVLMDSADLILMVTDTPEELPEVVPFLESLNIPALIGLNKIDVLEKKTVQAALTFSKPTLPVVPVSATMNENIPELMELLLEMLQKTYAMNTESLKVSHFRHQHHLLAVKKALDSAARAVSDQLPAECIIFDLREAISALDDITGKTTSVDILNHIFNQFCIGK